MNIFYIIGVVVVVRIGLGYFGLREPGKFLNDETKTTEPLKGAREAALGVLHTSARKLDGHTL